MCRFLYGSFTVYTVYISLLPIPAFPFPSPLPSLCFLFAFLPLIPKMTRFQALTWNLLQDHMGLDMATAILAIYLTSSYFHDFHLVHPGTDCPSESSGCPNGWVNLCHWSRSKWFFFKGLIDLRKRTAQISLYDSPRQRKTLPRKSNQGMPRCTKMYQLQHISRGSKKSSMLWAEALDSLEVCGLCTIQALPWVLNPDQSWGHMKKKRFLRAEVCWRCDFTQSIRWGKIPISWFSSL